jgi:hypothetical protein
VGGGAATRSERGAAKRHAGAVVNFPGSWVRARVAFNSARGSRRGKFGAQNGAKTRAWQKIWCPRHFRASGSGSRGLSRAANRRLIYHARLVPRLLEILLEKKLKLICSASKSVRTVFSVLPQQISLEQGFFFSRSTFLTSRRRNYRLPQNFENLANLLSKLIKLILNSIFYVKTNKIAVQFTAYTAYVA